MISKARWMMGQRYQLSTDKIGLLKYFTQKDFYHVHSDELTSLERWKLRALKATGLTWA